MDHSDLEEVFGCWIDTEESTEDYGWRARRALPVPNEGKPS